MAVTSASLTWVAGKTWLLSWTGGTAPYSVYRDGVLAGTTSATQMLVLASGGDVFEVIDSTESPSQGYPGRATLAWRQVSGAYRYVVEEYVGAQWLTRAKVQHDGRGYYQWRSRKLEDVSTHQFRVTAESEGGIQSTGVTFSVFMCRIPDVPLVSYEYSEDTDKVTVTEVT